MTFVSRFRIVHIRKAMHLSIGHFPHPQDTQSYTHRHTLHFPPGFVCLCQGLGSNNIDSNEKASSACRLIYSSCSSHAHISADIHTATVQSIVICCSESSSDVTNILVKRHKQQFPRTERPQGPLGAGVIWLPFFPHGQP